MGDILFCYYTTQHGVYDLVKVPPDFIASRDLLKVYYFLLKITFFILKIHHRGNGITSHFEMMFHQCLKRFYRNIVYRYMMYTARSTDFSFSLSINLLTDYLGIPIKDPYYYN